MAISWGFPFITGISEIDEQHQVLVALVNRLETAMADGNGMAIVEEAFRSLADYARVHFALEEKLMAEAGVDAAHVAAHRQSHAAFADDLDRMWHAESGDSGDKAGLLLEFVTTWVYRHILITDREMARSYFLKKGQAVPAPLVFA